MDLKNSKSSTPDSGEYIWSLSFADIGITLYKDSPLYINNSFKCFQKQSADTDWSLVYKQVDTLPVFSEPPLYIDYEYKIYETPDLKIVCKFKERESGTEYAWTIIDEEHRTVHIGYLPQFAQFFSEAQNCFFHSRWEKIFQLEGRMILHASFVNTQYGGLLFSGPSGVGKSTQSDLWIRYEGAELINGDRPVIYQQDNTWMASGAPYAGSSKCYSNKQFPVSAIIMLKQSDTCRISRLDQNQAFKLIFAMTTIYMWDRVFVEAVSDMIADLIGQIPIYCLECTPEKEAVDLLKSKLREDGLV